MGLTIDSLTVRLGIAMALLGTPFFFALLLRFRRSHAWA
jgi:ABC-type Fe3+-siderophore transport system permease subunit